MLALSDNLRRSQHLVSKRCQQDSADRWRIAVVDARSGDAGDWPRPHIDPRGYDPQMGYWKPTYQDGEPLARRSHCPTRKCS